MSGRELTGDELAGLVAELVEARVDRPFITLEAPPRRTNDGWSITVRRSESEGSYSTTSLVISDGHSEARLRAYLAAVGRHARATSRFPLRVGGPSLLDSPVDDDAFDRVLADPRACWILERRPHSARLLATLDPERRGRIPMLSNPELEAAIVDGDLDAHAIYGDWLAQRGDPRGELIAIQLARSTRLDDVVLAEREAELLDLHAYEWLGPLAWPNEGEVKARWRDGFLDGLVFDRATDEDLGSRNTLLDALRVLVTLPGLMCLHEVEFGGENHWPGEQFWTVLARVGLPPSVRRLAITASKRFLTKPVDISPVYPVLERLEELEIGFHDFQLGGTLPLPGLRHLALKRVSRDNAAALGASRWPKLERLNLRLSAPYEGDHMALPLDELAWLLEARELPGLSHLALGGTVTAALVTTLATSRLARQLRTLDLSEAGLTTSLGQALEAAKPALSHVYLRPPFRRG